jgi:site-specific recombinase XerD
VFPANNGRPKIGRVLTRDSRTIFNESGIPDPATVKWHTLRHSAASLWISAGMDIFSVSRRLGHASAAFTLSTYAHLMEGQDDVLAGALDALLA